jgi:DNA-binding transcriptional LysR family regulator
MDLRLLRYLVACVEHRTMHAAAHAANVSQPALSKAIKDLEEQLGVTLFDRHPRGIEPTPYGRTLFRYAKLMDSEMRHALAEIDAMRGMTRGTIVAGVIPTMAAAMSDVACSVMARHQGLKLKLRTAFSSELQPALLDGELDFALLLLPGEEPPMGLAFEPLLQTGPAVVVRAGHPLATGRRLSPAALARYPWLLPDHPATHAEIVKRAFLDAGVVPPSATVSVSTVVLFDGLIRGSDVVTVAPATLLGAPGTQTGLVALDTDLEFPPERIGLAYRQNTTLLPGARLLMDLVRQRCREMPGAIQPAPGAGLPSER